MKNIEIVEAMSDLGVHVDGADKGPRELEKYLTENKLHRVEKLNVKKDKDKENKEKNLIAVNEFNERLYNQVRDIIENGHVPLTIGGDHSIAIGSALASISKYENLGIIWFDAHGDYNTFDTTITGNIHGLPLAVITGYERKKLATFHNSKFYSPQNTVIVGARDLDDLEWVNLKDAGVTVFTTEDIKKEGAEVITEKAIKIASNGTQGMHISFDIDLIDPIDAPGVSVPAKDGITKEEAYKIVNEFLKYSDIIKSIDVVEYNPTRDINDKTRIITLDVINKIIKKNL